MDRLSFVYLSLRGRLSRKDIWLAALPIMVTFFAILLFVTLSPGKAELSALISVLVIATLCAVLSIPPAVKRLHDRGKSGWWYIPYFILPAILDDGYERLGITGLGFIGYVSLAISITLSAWGFWDVFLSRGEQGTNRFGPDPLGSGS